MLTLGVVPKAPDTVTDAFEFKVEFEVEVEVEVEVS
jgi:hypothetical protein